MSDTINSALDGVANKLHDKMTAEIKSLHSDIINTTKADAEKRDALNDDKLVQLNARMDTLQTVLEAKAADAQRPSSEESFEQRKAEFKAYIRDGLEMKASSVNTGLGGAGAAGQVLVPEFLDTNIVNQARNTSPLFAEVSLFKTATPDVKVIVNQHGLSMAWVDELTARVTSNTPNFAEVVVPMGHLNGKHQISLWALNDVFFDAEAFITQEVSDEIAVIMGQAILTGTGVNQPKGILSYATAATADSARAFGSIEHVATGTSASLGVSTTVAIQKLDTLIYSMKPAYRQNAKFVMNRLTIAQYRGFVDANGLPIWQPSTIAGQPSTLKGYAVIEAEDAPQVAANSLSVIFGDFSAYRVYDLTGMTMLRDPYSHDAAVLLKTNKRMGGALPDSDAIKVLKSSIA